MSCFSSVAPVSKSGSSSSGGTSTMLLRGGGPGRFGTTGLTLGGSGALGLAPPPNRGGAPAREPRVGLGSPRLARPRGDGSGRGLGPGPGGGGGGGGGWGRGAPLHRGRLGDGWGIHVQEHQARRLPLARLRRVVMRLNLGSRRPRRAGGRATLRIAVHAQVLFQRLPQVCTLRGDVGQLLHGGESVLDLPDLLHPLG